MTIDQRDRLYLDHMLECIGRIKNYTELNRSTFLGSEMVQDAVVRNLQTLAESSQKLSEDFKAGSPHIDWRAISGFRNILVHDYLGLDLERIWLVIEQDLPHLEATLRRAVD